MKIFLLMYLDAQFHSDRRQRRTESSQQNALSVRTNGPRDFIFRALLKLLLFPGYKNHLLITMQILKAPPSLTV